MQEDARGQEARARAEMARWIGAAAQRPLPETVPALEAPAASQALLSQHPAIAAAEAQERAAQRAVDVARQDRKPNLDRQSGVSGKSVPVRVALGGRRTIKKKQSKTWLMRVVNLERALSKK